MQKPVLVYACILAWVSCILSISSTAWAGGGPGGGGVGGRPVGVDWFSSPTLIVFQIATFMIYALCRQQR